MCVDDVLVRFFGSVELLMDGVAGINSLVEHLISSGIAVPQRITVMGATVLFMT